MHGFADASQDGIGFAIYARLVSDNQPPVCSLVFSRSLVVPTSLRPKPTKKGVVRDISIPKLELQAVKLLVKAIDQVSEFLQKPIELIQIWTDASTVIQWLLSHNPKDVFVRNRVPIIRKYSVKHVTTDQNPADMASRGVTPRDLMGSKLWWHGPSWLSLKDEFWPKPEFEYQPGDEVKALKEAAPFHSICCNTALNSSEQNVLKVEIFHPEKFDRFYRLRRSVAYVMKFIRIKCPSVGNCQDPLLNQVAKQSENRPFTAADLKLAELLLIRDTQRVHPPTETTALSLGVYDDENGLLRCRGRLGKCEQIADLTKDPFYLPNESNVTVLYLKHLHIILHHCGPSILIAEFRRKFWTPALRRLIQNTLYANKTTKCLPCSIMKLAPFEPPNEPALPSERINISRPFENVGIDYFGPYRVRLSGETKFYGLIFSCMTTRAIHLEITSGLTADKTMLAIRRFISRRGCPVSILSDNARQFQLVKSVIERTWSLITFDEKLMEFVSDKGIKWVHTTERAPWMGSI